MYSNQRAKARKVFCIKLMDYKKVDCLGKIMRNTEIVKARKDDEFFTSNWRGQAMNIYKDYKFVNVF